ncbi:MAG: Na-K-Cl cotransporter [Phycisphaeraceae bacterium]
MNGIKQTDKPQPVRFGTFGGVFTPCVLTILGVIMFLRFGQVVGQSGVWHALMIVLAAKAITTLTGLSLSAIATNTRVKGGGAYYLISRSLGVEFGGAIGVVFFFAQAISVAMYVVGFTEAFVDAFPYVKASPVLISSIVNVLVFVCVFIGAGWTIKVQYGILAVLGLSIAAIVAGAIPRVDPEVFRANLEPAYVDGQSFFTMFALFFPAVTGIMAGANMSGDLKDPARSIPRGTLWAILVTGAVYVGLALLLAAAAPRQSLIDNNLIVKEVSVSAWLVTAGIFAATLSSALGSMMGSPRILQAFAKDRVFKVLGPLAVGSGASNEPRRATVLTFLIAQTCIMLGDLNAIAPVITMAFMITYGTLNLATFYEAITKNPSYRPRFRFCHWSLSLLGAIGCLGVMFLIEPFWAGVSILAMVGLHRLIGRREVRARWGDVHSGLLFERARKNLIELEAQMYHPKNWRPIVLALSGAGWTRAHIPMYGHWLTAGHGILMLGQVIPGELQDRMQRRRQQEELLFNFIQQQDLEAFPIVVVAPDLTKGIESLVQCHGIGPLRPNTVMLGWPNTPDKAESFGSTLRTIDHLGLNIVAVKYRDETLEAWEVPRGTIDVWWRGKDNGPLMLLLAHLLTKNDAWRSKTIRLIRVVPNEAARQEVVGHLNELIESSRIDAEPVVITMDDPITAIHTTSREAAVVFLGLICPEKGEEKDFYESMNALTTNLNRVIFVHSTGKVSLET